jgi:hypothetical protein
MTVIIIKKSSILRIPHSLPRELPPLGVFLLSVVRGKGVRKGTAGSGDTNLLAPFLCGKTPRKNPRQVKGFEPSTSRMQSGAASAGPQRSVGRLSHQAPFTLHPYF